MINTRKRISKKLAILFFSLSILAANCVVIILFVVNQPHKDVAIASSNNNIEESSQNKENAEIAADKNVIETAKNSSAAKITKNTDFSKWNNSCAPLLVVINKDNPIPQNYKMDIVDYDNVKINSIVKNDLESMIAAATLDGVNLRPVSGYRSVERQITLFNNQVGYCKQQGCKIENAEVMAATVVAKPGTSEHHTGLAIDFNDVCEDFCTTPEYSWLIKNAAEYGFILRYPKDKTEITNVIYEPWHFRYVGKEYAKKIEKTGLCYEEYISLNTQN